MRKPTRIMRHTGLTMAMLLAAAPALAQTASPTPLPAVLRAPGAPAFSHPVLRPVQAEQETPAESRFSPEVQQSIGCALTGTVATVVALATGGENLVNIIAGGVVVPQNRAVLYIGLTGVVFASFCAIGQALTPLYLYATDTTPPAPEAPPAAVLSRTTHRATAPHSAHGPLAYLVTPARRGAM